MTLFEKIAAREIPAKIIWENDNFIAFLDINPIGKHHTLVVPKKYSGDYIFELDDYDYRELNEAVREVAKLLKKKTKCERVVSWVEGFEVPHVHVHLLPVNKSYEFKPEDRHNASEDDLGKSFELLTK